MRRDFQTKMCSMRRCFISTWTPPIAQRSRCFHSPLRVSGVSTQHSAFGSKRTSQCRSCSFQLTSMSSVSMFGLQ